MNQRKHYRNLRNLNMTIAGVSLGISYYLKKKNHGFLALFSILSAGKFLINAYDNEHRRKYLKQEEERIQNILANGPVKKKAL